MKKYFVVSDVHGYYDILRATLDENGFDVNNPDHIFCSCGDLFDRGNQAYQCLKFVMDLPEERRILIRGNHEDLLLDCLMHHRATNVDYTNGTENTIRQLSSVIDENDNCFWDCCDNVLTWNLYNEYEAAQYDYAIIGKYILVHGWVPVDCTIDNLDNCDHTAWRDARWLNGMEQWKYTKREWFNGYTIVCGHWHTSWGHTYLHYNSKEFGPYANFDMFVDDGITAIDACTAYSGKINCFIFEVE